MRTIGAVLAVALISAACAPSGLPCEEPTTLEPHPTDPTFVGARLGPLLIRQFADDAKTAVIGYFAPGYATKVVTVVAEPFTSPLTLRGWRCSDGVPLRFAWTYPFALNSTPAPSAVFAAAGEEEPLVQPTTSLPSREYGIISGAAAPPYFLFTSSGRWLLEVREGATTVGRAVLLIPQTH